MGFDRHVHGQSVFGRKNPDGSMQDPVSDDMGKEASGRKAPADILRAEVHRRSQRSLSDSPENRTVNMEVRDTRFYVQKCVS